MFDEESKEKLVEIFEDAGFDFDYEKEPEYSAGAEMVHRDIYFNKKVGDIEFNINASVANQLNCNFTGICVAVYPQLLLAEQETNGFMEILKKINRFNCIAGPNGFCCSEFSEELDPFESDIRIFGFACFPDSNGAGVMRQLARMCSTRLDDFVDIFTD